MSRRADWLSIVDSDLTTRRARYAAILIAEHARIAAVAARKAQERQTVIDAAIVQAREQRVQASRGHDLVRRLVEP